MKKFLLALSVLASFASANTNANTNNANSFDISKVKVNQLLLPNFVNTHCHFFKPLFPVLTLDESYVNKEGSNYAPVSCKGGVCWSWKVLNKKSDTLPWEDTIFSSNLPITIENTERMVKTISRTIKQEHGLRKSASSIINAAAEFIQNTFETNQKTQEQSIEQNVTPLFHMFLAKAVEGPFPAAYPFCISSAVDLFFKAYKTNRVDDLVRAWIIYETIKPQDIDLSNQTTLLNRAKFLYSLLMKAGMPNKQLERAINDGAWAQAVLFATLLNWPQFKDAGITQKIDSEIHKTYARYMILKNETTNQIAQKNKTLAALKYIVDKKYINHINPGKIGKQEVYKISDDYIVLAAFEPVLKTTLSTDEQKKLITTLTQAEEKHDKLLSLKLPKVHHKVDIKKITKYAIGIIVITAVIPMIFIAKKLYKSKRRNSNA